MNAVEKHRGDEEFGNGADDGALPARDLEEAVLVRGDDVKISRFASFRLRDQPERLARNPKTGEAATVNARQVVVFRPAGKLTARMKEAPGRSRSKGTDGP